MWRWLVIVALAGFICSLAACSMMQKDRRFDFNINCPDWATRKVE